LTKQKAAVYAFFKGDPKIEIGSNEMPAYLVYSCANCGQKVKQGLKTQDKGSTGEYQFLPTKLFVAHLGGLDQEICTIMQSGVGEKMPLQQSKNLPAALKNIKGWCHSFSTRPPEKETTR
jgi:hypothetical protein